MTDNEVIKALGYCLDAVDEGDTKTFDFLGAVIDLINRQKAEIVKLKDYNENLITANMELSDEILEIKSEAIKEFAERLKSRLRFYYQYQGMLEKEFCLIHIDNLVKEMTEGNE